MVEFLKTLLLLSFISGQGWSSDAAQELKSDVFHYHPSPLAKEHLEVRLEGESWYAVNVQAKDQDFIVSLFRNGDVMKWYGAGPSQDLEEILDRTLRLWLPRFDAGQPHGALLVIDKENQGPLGFIMGGLTDTPGVAAVAYAYAPYSWGRGIGSDVLRKFLNQWGGEVKRIGLGKEVDATKYQKTISDFCCFQGQPLSKFQAVVSPDNMASLRMLEKAGFKSQPVDVVPILNLTSCSSLIEMDMEAKIRTVINANTLDIKRGQYYKMIDEAGSERTFMIPERYDRIKYYLEYVLP